MDSDINNIRIGISSCLLGQKVRFDGGHKRNSFITGVLSGHFEFIPFCPEMAIGLGTPRETIRLVEYGQETRARGNKTTELDVTEDLIRVAEQHTPVIQTLSGYILKKDSPSCGMERVRLYNDKMPERKGVGIFAQRIMDNFPYLPVEEEGRLEDAVIRENFIQRIFIYARWQNLIANHVSIDALNKFHAKHKYIYMSHDQVATKDFGRWLAENSNQPKEALLSGYLERMMTILTVKASRKSHTNTLMHIRGYLKKDLDPSDKSELSEVIDNYRQGLLPLIVPITLLRHFFRKYPSAYIQDSYYMQPHPGELMLLNNL